MASWKEILYGMLHMPCLFHWITGLYCPGCGGTRAVKYLLKGQLLTSFIYHPLVLYSVVAIGLSVLTAWIAKATGNSRWRLGHEKGLIALGVGITVVNWLIKNYFLVVRGIDLLANG